MGSVLVGSPAPHRGTLTVEHKVKIGLLDSTIGKKAVMAVTGLILFGFVIVHCLGNLQLFLGADHLNEYAALLKSLPKVVWATRITLLVSILLHIWAMVSLYKGSMKARPVGYRAKQNKKTTYAAITMRFGGPFLALYVIFHLVHFTFPGIALGSYEAHALTADGHHDLYAAVVNGFRVWWVTLLIYIPAQIFLGMHLYHGGWSFLQTLGLSHPRYDNKLRNGAKALGITIAGANIIMPLAVLLGIVS